MGTDMTPSLNMLFHLNLKAMAVTRQLDRALGVHGISLTEFSVLDHLQRSDQALTQVALADRIGLTPSGMTRLLNPMVKRHLLDKQRDERDARQSRIQITEAGQELFEHAQVTCDRVAQSCARHLEPAQQLQLQSLLAELT